MHLIEKRRYGNTIPLTSLRSMFAGHYPTVTMIYKCWQYFIWLALANFCMTGGILAPRLVSLNDLLIDDITTTQKTCRFFAESNLLAKKSFSNYILCRYFQRKILARNKTSQISCFLCTHASHLTNSMAYGTRRFNAAFTRALQ